MAVAFMLAHNYGYPRIMSSYHFKYFYHGPPVDNENKIVSPNFNSFICGKLWICEHRWRQIYNMINFRNTVKSKPITSWWNNDSNQIAFCRGDSGFIAFNRNEYNLIETLYVCVPPGIYCDIISGVVKDNKCTGKTIYVNKNRKALIQIFLNDEDGVLAIHINAKLK